MSVRMMMVIMMVIMQIATTTKTIAVGGILSHSNPVQIRQDYAESDKNELR